MNLVPHGNVIVGFRPEHFFPVSQLAGRAAVPDEIRAAEREGPFVSLHFRIGHEEYLGAERIVYGRLEGGRFQGEKAISRMSSTYGGRFEAGSLHAFAVSEKHLKFFDREKGGRTARVPLESGGSNRRPMPQTEA